MKPKYSILLCNCTLEEKKEAVDRWLHLGIKVLWFGSSADADYLRPKYKAFSKALLFQCYVVEPGESFTVIDGYDPEQRIDEIAKQCNGFNRAQYEVEHCNTEDHVVVKASAGTGKTTVMIDRIMFLLHTVPDIRMSDIHMITFTNDAASQMDQRLQNVLMTRYRLTGQKRYVHWVEEQSQMNISTIHSFALLLLKEFGIGHSFTRNMTIRSFAYERKELIKDVLDKRIDAREPIWKQTGMSFYKAKALIDLYWLTLSNNGISHDDVKALDWGKPVDGRSAVFQKTLQDTIPKLDEEYYDFKKDADSISVGDIIRDLYEVLLNEEFHDTDLSIKYLFIDEFQDTDLSQIKVAAKLVSFLGSKLFVVGDVKQSIYRFRGANEAAFNMLDKCLEQEGTSEPKFFFLQNNYRTATSLMDRLHLFFKSWGEKEYLDYEVGVRAFNSFSGELKIINIARDQNTRKAEEESEELAIADAARNALDELSERIERTGEAPGARDRVVILTRTNPELKKISSLLRRNRVPASVVLDGSFYASEAVRDFYSLVCSFMFPDEPKHIFNFLLTPYAGNVDTMNIHTMEQLNGDYDKLVEYLFHFLEQTPWQDYYKQLRLRPVMAVIKDIIDQQPIVETFIANAKRRKEDYGWEEKRNIASTRTEAMQYQADIERLVEILERTFNGNKMSIYDLYRFLELQITSNASESEPAIEAEDDYRSVLCMTVHKAKGLEFDTVIIPYTDRYYLKFKVEKELLIDPITNEVGWIYKPSKNVKLSNDHYTYLSAIDNIKTEQEEARLLYVAMTRAINKLICFRVDPTKDHTWGYLLDMGVIS